MSKRILLVDDEETLLKSLIEIFRVDQRLRDSEFVVAHDGAEAIERIKDRPFHLVVTDLNMPGVDGLELLNWIYSNQRELPVIVMTAYGSEELRRKSLEKGAVQFVDKPVDIEVLTESMSELLSLSAQGILSGIQIPEFIQVVSAGHKSCTLDIRAGGQRGQLYFYKGQLVDADCDDGLSGLEAALGIVTWEEPTIQIRGNLERRENRINLPVDSLLMEAMFLRDESRRETRGDAGSLPEEHPSDTEALSDGSVPEALLRSIVSDCADLEDVLACCVIDSAGRLVIAESSDLSDQRILSESVAELTSWFCSTVSEAGFGTSRLLQITAQAGCICLAWSSRYEMTLAVVGGGTSNAGLISLTLETAIEKLKTESQDTPGEPSEIQPRV